MSKVARRNQAKPGLSYLDANNGRLITIEDDVLGIKREIEERWPDLINVYFDQEALEWVITELCKDGTERLAFTTDCLDQRTIERIHKADAMNGVDFLEAIDSYNEQVQVEKEKQFCEKIGDFGERLQFALAQDGIICRPPQRVRRFGAGA